MNKPLPPKTYRVLLNERWALSDLHTFPHTYLQVYSFVYCFDSSFPSKNPARVDVALREYPFFGGYSYLNIYSVLNYQIPKELRPQVHSIKYASPGWLDLLLEPEVALRIAKAVGIYAGLAVTLAGTIKSIDEIRLWINRRRREQRAEIVKATAQEVRELNVLCEELAKGLGFENLDALQSRTNDPEITLNLLLAHYRRIKVLGDYVQRGQIKLPDQLVDGTSLKLGDDDQ